MKRRGFLGLLAAIGLVKVPVTVTSSEVAAPVPPPVDPGCDGLLCEICSPGFSDITAELKRAYPPRFLEEACEQESAFRRAMKR